MWHAALGRGSLRSATHSTAAFRIVRTRALRRLAACDTHSFEKICLLSCGSPCYGGLS